MLSLLLVGCALHTSTLDVQYTMDISAMPVPPHDGIRAHEACKDYLAGFPLDGHLSLRDVVAEAGVHTVVFVEKDKTTVGPLVRHCVTVYGATEPEADGVADHTP